MPLYGLKLINILVEKNIAFVGSLKKARIIYTIMEFYKKNS
jgi:hypothetical protein